jgi:hypothetical protein
VRDAGCPAGDDLLLRPLKKVSIDHLTVCRVRGGGGKKHTAKDTKDKTRSVHVRFSPYFKGSTYLTDSHKKQTAKADALPLPSVPPLSISGRISVSVYIFSTFQGTIRIRPHSKEDAMTTNDDKLLKISDDMNEHLLAVKGTLELLDASVPEEELRDLITKAIDRIDKMQGLSNDMFAALKHCLDRMSKG